MTARLRVLRGDTETLDVVTSGSPAGSIRTNAAKTARVFGDAGIWLAFNRHSSTLIGHDLLRLRGWFAVLHFRSDGHRRTYPTETIWRERSWLCDHWNSRCRRECGHGGRTLSAGMGDYGKHVACGTDNHQPHVIRRGMSQRWVAGSNYELNSEFIKRQ